MILEREIFKNENRISRSILKYKSQINLNVRKTSLLNTKSSKFLIEKILETIKYSLLNIHS